MFNVLFGYVMFFQLYFRGIVHQTVEQVQSAGLQD